MKTRAQGTEKGLHQGVAIERENKSRDGEGYSEDACPVQ